MKLLFKNTTVLISQLVMLILAILWYLEDFQKEPLIAIISLSVSLIVTIYFRNGRSSKDDEVLSKKIKVKGNFNSIIQDNKGSVKLTKNKKNESN